MMQKEIEKLLNEALNIMKTWNKELYDETLQDPKEVARLIKRQKEYDDFVHTLAENEYFVSQMKDVILNTKDRYIRLIAIHVVLLSKNMDAIDLHANGIQGHLGKVLSYCEKDVVDFWMSTLLNETKKHFLHQISSFADYIAKNCLSQYVDLFIEDDKLIYNCSNTYEMLAMTQHPKAKEILRGILTYTTKTKPDNVYDIEYAAICLMLLGDEYGMQYFRERLSGGDPSYEDMGREVALWGNRSDIMLLLNFIKKYHNAADVLARTRFNGDKRLIYFYLDVMKSDWNEETGEEMREIAYEALVDLFIPEEEQEEYYEILESDVWEDIVPMWEKWIAENYEKLPDIRYYEARIPWHIKDTLHEVKRSFNNPIAVSRWQRVIIHTGHIMPFDPMAYYEKQLAQNKAMEEWIDAQGEGRFKEGRWYRFGKDVSSEPTPPLKLELQAQEHMKERAVNTHATQTGNHQAHLPQGHPDADKLKADPFAYSHYEKGQVFDYKGLEDYDTNLIVWRPREEE